MENVFLCPVCGAVHKTNVMGPHIFNCQSCHQMFIAGESPDSCRVLDQEEWWSACNTSDMPGLPYNLRMNRGIPIPMLNGGKANLLLGDKFYQIPEGETIQSLYYAALVRGFNPSSGSLRDLLECVLPDGAKTVDAFTLRNKVGSQVWDRINKGGCFVPEKDG